MTHRYLAIAFLFLTWCCSAAADPTQMVLAAKGPFGIPGGDGQNSALVSDVTLTLTRDVTTSNKETTYWTLRYNYFNGSLRWEGYQEMYLDFVDSRGVTLVDHAISTLPPANTCHYAPGIMVTDKGRMTFDFRGRQLAISITGKTPGPFDRKDHKC